MRYLFNAVDFKVAFNTIITNGVNQFMQLPDRKDSVSTDFQDTDGIDIDLDTPKFAARAFDFNCVTIGETIDQYKQNYFGLFALLKQQGTYTCYCDEVDMTLGLYYKKQINLSGLYRTPERYFAQTFTLQFGETNPFSNIPIVELVDDGYNVLVP